MSDCSNAEIRDLLPDLVRDGLASAERARVEAHVGECVDCTDEVALLRTARRSLSAGVPAVSVADIVRALPSPRPSSSAPTPGVVSIDAARRARVPTRLVRWRQAAAIAAIAAGVTTVAVTSARRSGDVGSGSVAVAPGVARGGTGAGTETVLAVAPVTRGQQAATVAQRDAGISMAGGVADLSEDALAALLGDIDDIDAAPGTEPADPLPEITGEENE